MSEEQRKKSNLFNQKFVINDEKRGLRSSKNSSVVSNKTKSSIPVDNPLLSQPPSNSIIHKLIDSSKSPEESTRINDIELQKRLAQRKKQLEIERLLEIKINPHLL